MRRLRFALYAATLLTVAVLSLDQFPYHPIDLTPRGTNIYQPRGECGERINPATQHAEYHCKSWDAPTPRPTAPYPTSGPASWPNNVP